jgi:hypothetical protein
LERDNQKAAGPLLDLADPSATELNVPRFWQCCDRSNDRLHSSSPGSKASATAAGSRGTPYAFISAISGKSRGQTILFCEMM